MPNPKRALGWHHIFFTVIVPLFYFSSICQAALVNRTIDDSLGDLVTGFKPIYHPSGPWDDQTCSGCAIQPDPSLAYDGTWMAATYNPTLNNISITLQFTGVSIWVFFILANANQHGPTITSNTNCNFTLDGSLAGTFVHQPDMSTLDLNYNATAFAATSLSNTPHQLIISTNGVPFNVFVNFDYAIYTAVTADSSPPGGTSSSSSSASSSSTSSGSSSSISTSTTSNSLSTTASTSSTGASIHSSPSTSGSTSSTSADTSSNKQASQSSTSSASPSSSQKVGIIVGAVLGGVALIVISLMIFLFRRRSQSRENVVTPMVQPSTVELNAPPYRDDVTTSHLPWQRSTHSDSFGAFASAPRSGEQGGSLPSLEHNTTSSTPLLPVRGDQQTQITESRKNLDEVRAMRQMEINQRLQSAQRQVDNLTSRQSMPPPNDSGVGQTGPQREMEDMREQLRLLRGQIEHLQSERQSDWAMGLSDAPPPAYA